MMSESASRPKRVGNHYIPPPARKQGAETPETRIKERPTKTCSNESEKLCNDSSLLFKDNCDEVSSKLKSQRKRRSKKEPKPQKNNNENSTLINHAGGPAGVNMPLNSRTTATKGYPREESLKWRVSPVDQTVINSHRSSEQNNISLSKGQMLNDVDELPPNSCDNHYKDDNEEYKHLDDELAVKPSDYDPLLKIQKPLMSQTLSQSLPDTYASESIHHGSQSAALELHHLATTSSPEYVEELEPNYGRITLCSDKENKTETSPSSEMDPSGPNLPTDNNSSGVCEPFVSSLIGDGSHLSKLSSSAHPVDATASANCESSVSKTPVKNTTVNSIANSEESGFLECSDKQLLIDLQSDESAITNKMLDQTDGSVPSVGGNIFEETLSKTGPILEAKGAGDCKVAFKNVSRPPDSKSHNSMLSIDPIDDGDWDSLYDDCGDCIMPQVGAMLLEEKIPNEVKIQQGPSKQSTVKSSPRNFDDEAPQGISTIIEIYGFPEELKTSDLMTVFCNYLNRGFNLKWVDNTHALGVLPTTALAEEVLSLNLPIVKTRPISQGIALSQEKARNLVLPSSLRPKTCTALARRLVSGALGLRVSVTPEERAAERELLKEAREKKKLVSKQKDAAWEGNFSSPDICDSSDPS